MPSSSVIIPGLLFLFLSGLSSRSSDRVLPSLNAYCFIYMLPKKHLLPGVDFSFWQCNKILNYETSNATQKAQNCNLLTNEWVCLTNLTPRRRLGNYASFYYSKSSCLFQDDCIFYPIEPNIITGYAQNSLSKIYNVFQLSRSSCNYNLSWHQSEFTTRVCNKWLAWIC